MQPPNAALNAQFCGECPATVEDFPAKQKAGFRRSKGAGIFT
jgi:hypothetical protein